MADKDIFKSLLNNSEGITMNDDYFKLPEPMDFLSDSFSADLYNKINNKNLDKPLYLEQPFSLTPGYHDEQRVFLVKALPYVENIVKRQLDNPYYERLSKLKQDLFTDDGDTIYFMNSTIHSGNSSFTLGERHYENFEEFLNVDENGSGTFGVRFLGINTPEIPHYTSVPYTQQDLHTFKYGEIKTKTNVTCLDYKPGSNGFIDRNDEDEITFFYDQESDAYFEVISTDYELSNLNTYDTQKTDKTEVLKMISYDESNKETVEDGIAAALTVREMIGNAEDLVIMLDYNSLSRQSNYYNTPYANDYFSLNYATGLTPWTTVCNYWNRFYSDERYKYLGFNAWGQDNNKRMLGTVYVKVVVPELGGEAQWINLTKYVLQKHMDKVTPLPDYTSDPNQEANFGYVSNAFKLWSYDLQNQVVLDGFTSYTEDYIKERNRIFEQMAGCSIEDIKEYTMILGDNVFVVPPTSIRCISQIQTEKVQLLRSRGTAPKQSPASEKIIEIKLYFNNAGGINGTPYEATLPNGQNVTYYMNGLRGLIAQFKLTPFLPIENNYINEVLTVDAVSLVNLRVNTMQGFPKCVEVVLTLQEFNYYVYMPDLPIPEISTEQDLKKNMFARTIHYPVLRWYYQRLLQRGESIKNLEFNSPEFISETYGKNTALIPMNFEDSTVEFYLPDKLHLDRRLQVAYEKEARSVRAYYPLTEEGKQTIVEMAPVFSDLLQAINDNELVSGICDPYVVDYSKNDTYGGHTLYNLEERMPRLNAEGGLDYSFTKYNFKLRALQNSTPDITALTYINQYVSNFKKIDFSAELMGMDIENASAVAVYSTSQQWEGAEVSGTKEPADALKEFFANMEKGAGRFGNIEIKESLNYEENRMIFDMLIPMPQLMASQFEREEFCKNIITQLGVPSINEVFSYNSGGALCIPVTFYIDCEVSEAPVFGQLQKVFTAAGDMALDYDSYGIAFLEYCDTCVKKIYSETGDVIYGDFVGDSVFNTGEEVEDLNKQNYIESEESIKFEKYDFGEDVVIENIACLYNNGMARIKLNAMDGYASQFVGGQDTVIEISITTKNQATVSLLQNLPRIASSYVTDYRQILTYWPLRIKSQITQLFGINEVLIDTVDTSTVPNFPGLYTIKIRMTSVDRSTRNRESLKKLEGVDNAGNAALGAKQEYSAKTFFELKETLGKAEIYPDLELPTIDDLEYAGYTLMSAKSPASAYRKYVDPDFYFYYAHVLAHEVFRMGIQKGLAELDMAMQISDKEGNGFFIEEDKKQEDPFIATPMNKSTEESLKIIGEKVVLNKKTDTEETLNTKAFNDLSERAQVNSKLAQTIAGLKTPTWNISNDLSFPLREKQYDTVFAESRETDDVYMKHIKKYENQYNTMIDTELSTEINLKDIDLNVITRENFDSVNLASPTLMIKWTEDRLWNFSEKYNEHKEFIKNLAHSATNTIVDKDLIYKTLLSVADTYSSYAFNEDKTMSFKIACFDVNLDNAFATEDDKQGDTNWKARAFMSFGQNMWNEKGEILWENVQPWCKMSGASHTYARNLDEAVNATEPRSFGIFGIQMYPKETILSFLTEDERNEVLESDLEFFFLDPFYRRLQINNPKSELLIAYKENCLLDPAYCAYAYIRNLMVWYRYLIQEEMVISMYETIKDDAASQVRTLNTEVTGYSQGQKTEQMNDLNSEKGLEEIKQAYINTFNGHAECFARVFAVMFDTSHMEQNEVITLLRDKGVPEELDEAMLKYHDTDSKALSAHLEWIKNNRQQIIENTDMSQAEKDIEIDNYDKMLRIMSYDPNTNTQIKVSETDLVRYSTEITRSMENSIEEIKINYQALSDIYDQLTESNGNIVAGKFIGLSMLHMKTGGSILKDMRGRKTESLNSLLLSLQTPRVNGDNDILRKYLLALDGRRAVDLKYVGVPTQSPEELIRYMIQEKVYIERCNDVRLNLRDSYLDMLANDKRGRMLRAFPTYYVLFIDEGRKIGIWKLHDNFYNMNAISEITVTKSRKIAADTAQIVMTNMFGTYSEEDAQRDYESIEINNLRYNMRDAFSSIFSPRVYAMQEEQKRQLQEEFVSCKLQPGVRVHIRMGYGANAADLPTVFNGNIAEVGASDVVNIIAQGDGRELLNPITDIDDSSDISNRDEFFIEKWVDNWLTNGATPKEIMTALLLSKGTWLQEFIRNKTDGRFFNTNPYGIMHFGDPDYKDVFQCGEVSQNIYEANPRASYGNKERYSGLEENYDTSETPKIAMHLLGKSFWDVMNICASVQPDYITAITTFGMRSSIFYGAPRYYYAYDYDKYTLNNGDTMIREIRKPFQQNHIYTSYTDIILNNIRASSQDLKTNAVGVYQEKMLFGQKVKQVGPLFIDFDIYPENQKSMTVDTQLWAQGLPVVGNVFGWASSLSKDVSGQGSAGIPGSKEIAWRMTASALKNSVKDMYVGELIVMGDPSVKPFDRMSISDTYERMDGECEVEAVVHSLNIATGYTTSIFADCVSIVDDKYEEFRSVLRPKIEAYTVSALVSNCAGLFFHKSGQPILSSALKMASKPMVSAATIANNLSKFLGADDLNIADSLIRGSDKIASIANGGDVQSTFKSIFDTTMNKKATKLSNLGNITFNTLGEADDYLRSLEGVLETMDDNTITKEIQKQANKDVPNPYANNARVEYDDIIKSHRKEINKLIQTDDDLARSIGQLLNNQALDNVLDLDAGDVGTVRDVLTAAKSSPDFFTDPKNIKGFREALIMSSPNATDDVINVSRAVSTLASSSDDVAKIALSVGDDLMTRPSIKSLFTIGAAGGVPGIVMSLALIALEMAATAMIGAYASETIYRYMQNLEVLRVYPLKRKGRAMVAGIDGHKGIVVGSPTEGMQGEWTNFCISLFDGEKGGVTKTLLNYFVVNKDIIDVTRRLRRENGLPVPADSNIELEETKRRVSSQMDKIFANNSLYSTRQIMRLERIESLSIESKKYLDENLIPPTFDKSPVSSKLTLETYPIIEDEEMKKYVESGFVKIFNYVDSGSTLEDIPMTFNGKSLRVCCYKSSQGAWIVPTLRPDAMIALRDVMKLLFKKLNIASFTKDVALSPSVLITSATVIGGKATWENTGLAFRLQVTEKDFTTEQLKEFCHEVIAYYESIGAPNFIKAQPVHNNIDEAIFIVKPRK